MMGFAEVGETVSSVDEKGTVLGHGTPNPEERSVEATRGTTVTWKWPTTTGTSRSTSLKTGTKVRHLQW